MGLLGFLGTLPAAADGELDDILGIKGRAGASKPGADWTATLLPGVRQGEVTLRISAKVPNGSWIYSTAKGIGEETRIDVRRADGLEPVGDGFVADHNPEAVRDAALDKIVEKFHDQVTWSRNFRVKEGANQKAILVSGLVNYQICDTSNCRQMKYEFKAELTSQTRSDSASSTTQSGGSNLKTRPEGTAEAEFQQFVGPRDSQRLGSAWSVSLAPRQAEPGGEVTLTIAARMEPGWHVYALDQEQTPDGQGPLPTVIEVTGALTPLASAFTGPAPLVKPSEGFAGLNERYHEGHVEWTRTFRVPNKAEAEISLGGRVAWTMCNSGGCQPATGFEFQGSLIVADHAIPESGPLAIVRKLRSAEANEAIDEIRRSTADAARDGQLASSSSDGGGPTISPAPLSSSTAGEAQATGKVDGAGSGKAAVASGRGLDRSQGLPLFLTAAVLAGFAALLTPCVFPMIPITVSFFQKQSEKQHHRPVTMASVYCLGIIGTFTGLGMMMSVLFSATAIQQLASHWLLNLFIAGVLVFFAFNLMGMFEIQIPSWLLTYTSGQESRGGFIGVLFMALTFTLTSFTCTFAFAGGLLAAAAGGDRLWPILGLMAFSAAFSLPFFFLALFPSMLQKLPKSGGWMNVVKVIMGLIELGAAFKFFGNVDTTWNGQPQIFDFHLMISAWAVISIAAAMYLLGLFRLPHDTPGDHIGVIRFTFAMSFLGLASYLGVGLFASDKPHGQVWKYVEAFANPNFEGGRDPSGPFLKHGGLKYALDLDRAFETAVAENRPLFLDFTGVTCTNCRYMEQGPMSQPDIAQRLSRFVRVQLFTDKVPIDDRAEAERLKDFNVRLQENWFTDVTLPSYVIIPPDRKALEDRSQIIWALTGKAEEAAFARFLDKGLEGWQKVQAQRSAPVVGRR
jgi:thiol:disulfide interchange protein DsbD